MSLLMLRYICAALMLGGTMFLAYKVPTVVALAALGLVVYLWKRGRL